jgi:hypothetical protein
VLERMVREAEPLAREYQARMTELYGELRRRHSWMSSFFRTRAWNDADVDELVNETLSRYMRDLGGTLWVTGGVQGSGLEPLVEDGELIGFTLPVGPRAPAQPIKDIESYTFSNPKAWLRKVAQSVLDAYSRKSATERKRYRELDRPLRSPTRKNGEDIWLIHRRPPNLETREIRMRYIRALEKLPPIQRAAWILCKDELLTQDEAEPLLVPPLHWRAARAALVHKPLPDAEVSRLLSRADVSPDASKAKGKLSHLLSDLNPFKASQRPAPKWPREFLAGPHNQPGSHIFLRLGLVESDEREEQHESLCTPKQERLYVRSMEAVPGWVRAPEPDEPQDVELLNRIRELLKARKRATTIAEILNATQVPPRFGTTWHHTAVSLFARRAGLVKPRPPSKASQQTPMELTAPSIADNKAAEASPPSASAGDALVKTPGRSRAGIKPSGMRSQRGKFLKKAAQKARRSIKAGKDRSITGPQPRKTSLSRAQSSKPVQKAPRNALRPTKAAQDPSLKERKPGMPSVKRAQRSKPAQKVPRSALGPIRAGQGRSVTRRKPRKSSASIPVQRGRMQRDATTRDATAANAARRVAAQPLPRKPEQQSKRVTLPSTALPSARTSRNTPSPRPRP